MEQATTKKSTLARINAKMVPRRNSGESNVERVDSDATVRACEAMEQEETQPRNTVDRDCSRHTDLPLPTTSRRRGKWKSRFKSARRHTGKARDVSSQELVECLKRTENYVDDRIKATQERATALEAALVPELASLGTEEDSANSAIVVRARSEEVPVRQVGDDEQVQLCRFFREFGCKHGSSCVFAHQIDPAIQQNKREAKERERDALVVFNALRGEAKSSCG